MECNQLSTKLVGNNMEAWQIFLFIFGFVVLIIIIAALRRKKQKKEPRQAVHTYLEHGDYVSAGRMFLRQKKEIEAANLYFQMPPDKKPLYESMILQQLGAQSAQLFWIKTGRRLERSSPDQAKMAYLLAGAHFDAVKMFIDRNNPTDAIEIVKQIPISHQESTVRRLSQYAFNRGKYPIAADLLRAIGLVDEGDAILAVAAHEFGAIERPEIAATMYDSVGRQDLAGESQEHRGEQALSQGKIEEAKAAFAEAVKAYDESNQPKNALRVEERLKKFNLLDKFRDYAADGNAEAAEDMIDEISTSFPAIAMSDLYAEIASVLERSGRPSESVTYYDKAADSTNNPVKRQGYVNALRRVGSLIASQRGKGESVATANLSEKCIVCKRQIRKGERIVSCPHCKAVAHYSHFVEWLKVQGECPSCHARLKVDDIK
ncbi:MAG: E3 ubiquitin protein ligase [Candidatus Heimdallarchaeota archaeon]|nr:E3 ubiquitin protein ligase [Candidatus Heimdallarchaeota archaeon]